MPTDPARRAARRTARGHDLLLGGGILLLVLVAVAALGSLLQGSAWWWLSAFVAAVVLLSGVGFRALGVGARWVPVLELVVLLGVLTLFFGGGTALLGFIPTPATLGEFGALVDAGATSIRQQATPAIVTPGLVFVLVLGAGVLATAMDIVVITVRMPALAAVPALVPLVIPGFIVSGGTPWGMLVLAGAAYLLLLRVDVRLRRSAGPRDDDPSLRPRIQAPAHGIAASTVGATLGLAGIGLLTAAVLAAATPSISTTYLFGTGPRGTLFSGGVSPFIDLGQDLRRPQAVDAFHYTSADGTRPYFTLMTLDRIEGTTWTATERPLDSENDVAAFPVPPGLGDGVEQSSNELSIVIDEVNTKWLPQAYPAASISGLEGEWFWDVETLAVQSADSTTLGQRYIVEHLLLEPAPEQLRRASQRLPETMASYLELPGETPEIVTETARTVTETAGSPYDAAVQIQRYLRGVEFEYSTEAPVEAGYDGAGVEVVGEFLEKKSGYCVHFASAMAVLAREVGIPARVSIGFTAGDATGNAFAGRSRYTVDTHDLHAWPELYFDGVGWLPFEPTPSRGVLPSYSRPVVLSDPGAVGTPTPAPVVPDDPADRLLDGRDTSGGPVAVSGDDLTPLLRAGAVALAVLLLLLAPAIVRTIVRMRRSRAAAMGRAPATAAWRELEATATDLGFGPLPTESPRSFAERLGAHPGFGEQPANAALLRLRRALERERYGPPAEGPRPGVEAELALALRTVERGQPALVRARARLAPTSLAAGLPFVAADGAAARA